MRRSVQRTMKEVWEVRWIVVQLCLRCCRMLPGAVPYLKNCHAIVSQKFASCATLHLLIRVQKTRVVKLISLHNKARPFSIVYRLSCSRMSTERRSNRLRGSPLPTPDSARYSYLYTLADDNLRVVLRYLSCRPQHLSWHAYIPEFSVKTALDVGGAFRRVASSEFHSLGGKDSILFDPFLDASMLHPLVHRLPLRRLFLELRDDQVSPDLLFGCGAELREFVLDARGVPWLRNPTSLPFLAIVRNFPHSQFMVTVLKTGYHRYGLHSALP